MIADQVRCRSRGEVFLDQRGTGRALRLTWHHEHDVVVLSLWRGTTAGRCVGSFQLALDDVPGLIQFLVEGLAASQPPGTQDLSHAS